MTSNESTSSSSSPGMVYHYHHHEGEVGVGTETALALSYIEHMLFDSKPSMDELEGLRRSNLEGNGQAEETEQLVALKVQELEAALLGKEVEPLTAATQPEQEQPPQSEQGSFYGIDSYIPHDFSSLHHFFQCPETATPQAQEQGSPCYGDYVPPVSNPQLQEPAAPHAQESIAAAQGMPQQQQQELGLGWFYENCVPPYFPSDTRSLHQPYIQFQEPSAPHALQTQETIAAALGMPELTQLGLGSFNGIGNFPPHDLPPFQSLPHSLQIQQPATSHSLQAQQATAAALGMPELTQLGLGSFTGIGNYPLHDLPPFRSLPHSIQIQQPATSHALQAQQATAAAQGMPELGLESFHGIGNYAPHDLRQLPSFPHTIQVQEHGASHTMQAQPTTEAQEPGSYYDIDNYVPPDLPPVPSIQHLIQECSKPFEKQLSHSDVKYELRVLQWDAERHVLPLLNPNDNLQQGIWVTTYDNSGNEYSMCFKIRIDAYNLFGVGWKKFLKLHGLVKDKDFVTLWPFRNAQTGNLCFAITSRRLPVSKPLNKFERIRQS